MASDLAPGVLEGGDCGGYNNTYFVLLFLDDLRLVLLEWCRTLRMALGRSMNALVTSHSAHRIFDNSSRAVPLIQLSSFPTSYRAFIASSRKTV